MGTATRRSLASLGAGAVLLATALAVRAPAAAAPPLSVRERSEQIFAFPDPADAPSAPRVDRPYFDAAGRLRWADVPIHARATGACDTAPPQRNANGYPLHPRRTRLLSPRVDERSCSREGAPAQISLLGLDDAGAVRWERDTAFASGAHRIGQWPIGASPEGLVLGSLEVWSPQTGETILPAATRAIPSESRAAPRYTFTGAALYHPIRRTLFVFDAEVALTSSRGGVFEIDPATGAKTLRHPVATTWLRGFDRVEEMVLSADGRLLCLAQRVAWRGPTDVSLAILDLASERLLFLERFCDDSGDTCAEPHVVVGPGGAIGFSYADLNRREHHLLRYAIGP